MIIFQFLCIVSASVFSMAYPVQYPYGNFPKSFSGLGKYVIKKGFEILAMTIPNSLFGYAMSYQPIAIPRQSSISKTQLSGIALKIRRIQMTFILMWKILVLHWKRYKDFSLWHQHKKHIKCDHVIIFFVHFISWRPYMAETSVFLQKLLYFTASK